MNKQKLLEGLYSTDKDLRLRVRLKKEGLNNNSWWWSVQLVNPFDKKPDCQIGSFAKNFYFRTKKGKNKEKYNSLDNLLQAIKNKAKEYNYYMKDYKIENHNTEFNNIIHKEVI